MSLVQPSSFHVRFLANFYFFVSFHFFYSPLLIISPFSLLISVCFLSPLCPLLFFMSSVVCLFLCLMSLIPSSSLSLPLYSLPLIPRLPFLNLSLLFIYPLIPPHFSFLISTLFFHFLSSFSCLLSFSFLFFYPVPHFLLFPFIPSVASKSFYFFYFFFLPSLPVLLPTSLPLHLFFFFQTLSIMACPLLSDHNSLSIWITVMGPASPSYDQPSGASCLLASS